MTTIEQGRRLEASIAAYFASHGYATRTNVWREGRSGGRHEIDVLAERSDALTTVTIAVECKAWQSPIEKDVVSKLHHVMYDLGLNKGIVVSLSGCTSGAQQAADALGIDLWGPDELRRHLGDAAFGSLTVPVANRTVAWGLTAHVPQAQAEETLRNAGKGRFNVRTLETLVWSAPVWLPAHCVRLSVAQPETRLLKARLKSTSVSNLYNAIDGHFLGRAPHGGWEQVEIGQRAQLPVVVRDTKVHAPLRKAFEAYRKVTTEAAVARHTANLASLGIPTPCRSLNVDQTDLVYLPYYAGFLQTGTQERVVAVDGRNGHVSEVVSQALTRNVTTLRSHFSGR